MPYSDRGASGGEEGRNHLADRRQFLKAAGVLSITGVTAGCLGGDEQDEAAAEQDDDEQNDAANDVSGQDVESFENEAGNPVGATFDAVEELAKEEDGVTVYATIDREPFSEWLDAFHEEYPDVDVNHITGGSEDLISRWDGEYKSDNVQADIYISTSKIKRTWQDGQTMTLEEDYLPSLADVPEKFRSSDGEWIALRQVIGGLHFNTEMASEDDVDDWMDAVTDDQWADQKIGWDPTPNMFLMSWLFETQGEEFFENLRDQRPRFVDSHTDLLRFAGAGEFPISFTYIHKMARFGDKLPVDYFKFDPLPSVVSPTVINNKAPSPNSALLFLNFMTSAEGQTALGESQYIPWHPEAEYVGYPGVYPSDEYEVDVISPEVDTEETEEKWKEIMGDLLG